MRLAIVVCALLAIAAQPPACGSPTTGSGQAIVGPWEAACQGLACGDPCGFCPPGTDPKACPVPTFAATACNARGQCVTAGTFLCSGESCQGRACGDDCDPCGGLCMHPYASACDFAGRCVPKGPFICYDPCAGLACGATCHACPPDALDCAETAVVKACDRNGICQMLTPMLTCP